MGLFSLLFLSSLGLRNTNFEARGNRSPASELKSCFGLMQLFISKKTPQSGIWKRFKNYVFKGKRPLDMQQFRNLKERYIREISELGYDNVEVEKTPEGILAFIEALNSKNQLKGSRTISDNLPKLNFFKRRKLYNTIDLLKGEKPPLFQSMDDLLSDLYLSTKAQGFGLRELLPWQGAHRKALTQIVQEDLAHKGLTHVFEKYRLLEETPGFLRKFIHSKKGTFLATGVFNIPMAFGIPFPLHLPKFKGIHLPEDMARELLMRGLTEEMMIRVDKHITKTLYEGLQPSMTKQLRYRVIRNYYMMGASAVLTFIMVREYYLLNEATGEELEVIEDMADEMAEKVADINTLQEGHFQIFEDGKDPAVALSERKCFEIKDCLLDFKEEIGKIPVKGERFYNVCKKNMDTEALCKEY